MRKTLFKNDDLIIHDEATDKLKASDDLSRAAEKLKRDSLPDDIFLLDPRNYKILQGKGVPFNYNWFIFAFSLASTVLMVLIIGYGIQSGLVASAGPVYGLIVLAILGAACAALAAFSYLSVKLIRNDKDFAENGVLLIGTLSSIDGGWKRTAGTHSIPQYTITVDYNVELPDGTVISKTAWAVRRDLEDLKARPKQGTPVAVQYSPKSKKVRLL